MPLSCVVDPVGKGQPSGKWGERWKQGPAEVPAFQPLFGFFGSFGELFDGGFVDAGYA